MTNSLQRLDRVNPSRLTYLHHLATQQNATDYLNYSKHMPVIGRNRQLYALPELRLLPLASAAAMTA